MDLLIKNKNNKFELGRIWWQSNKNNSNWKNNRFPANKLNESINVNLCNFSRYHAILRLWLIIIIDVVQRFRNYCKWFIRNIIHQCMIPIYQYSILFDQRSKNHRLIIEVWTLSFSLIFIYAYFRFVPRNSIERDGKKGNIPKCLKSFELDKLLYICHRTLTSPS